MMKTLRTLSLLALLPVLVSCGGGGDSGCAAGLGVLGGAICGSSSPNTAPVANAGVTQNVRVASLVTLDGSGSRDENNDTLTYLWEMTAKPTGSVAALSSNTSAKPQFTADLAGTYTITLVVDDGKVKSPVSSATVVASVTNSAPVANAGVNQNVSIGRFVTLDGTASTDANSDTLSYKWSLLSKPTLSAAVLSSTTSPNPTFTADVVGIFTFGLVVNDGKVDSTMVSVTVVASSSNSAPVANAGVAQSVVAGAVVTLDGTGSTDANNDPITYKWSWGTRPTGSTAALSSETTSKPTFTASTAGTYVLTLVVNDGKSNSDVAAVTVTASVANAAPVANAGTNQNVTVPATVTLDGSASSDANRDPLTYLWTLVSRPTSSTAALSSTTSAKPTFSADVAGVYVASLVVNDGALRSPVTTTTITAAVANSAPVANAGVAQNVTTGSVVTLDGSASADANRDVLTYSWTLVSRPTSSTATLSSTTSAKPTFSADISGVYLASLVVNDGALSSPVSTTTITAAVANSAPVANAGVAQNVTTGSVVTLTGAGSTDANGDTLTYIWSFASMPSGSTAALSSTSAVSPTFTANLAGTYVVNLLVNDGKVNSSNVSAVTVTASAANSTPVANAGVNQTVARTSTVTLTGAGSTDANGDTLTYLWALTTRPTSSTASLSSTTVVSPTFVADIAGIYVATLIVNDGKVSSTVATVAITVN
jgi:hypothetical protein